jgi:pantetheine-phosphate adenylyltransferase
MSTSSSGARRLVDTLIVGVGANIEKQALFDPHERAHLIQRVTEQYPNVEVRTFTGLAVEFVREVGSRVIIRGVRPLADMPAEFTMMMANRQLDPDIETVLLMADEDFAHISSSLVRQITPIATDEQLAKFFPRAIIPELRAKLA